MGKPVEVPQHLYHAIPDDADRATAMFMRAQMLIQSAFFTFGDQPPGLSDLLRVLATAQGLILSADKALANDRDVREAAMKLAKSTGNVAVTVRRSGDRSAEVILAMLATGQGNPN